MKQAQALHAGKKEAPPHPRGNQPRRCHQGGNRWGTAGRASALVLAVMLSLAPACCPAAAAKKSRPNILLIVADDMGYSDLGCFGGEIRTPNLDALAARGLRATDFYVAPSCSPSRSMLLTGADHHQAGIGNMAEWAGPLQRGRPGYEGHLNQRVVSVATLLRQAGYHTCMAGKWHLGEKPEHWPAAHGFERDFTLLQGAASHWADMLGLLPTEPKATYTLNGRLLERLPDGYYSSKNLTDFVIEVINEHQHDQSPFFAYLAYQAPHGPLAVPEEWRRKYRGRYDKGYDVLRQERLARQKNLGIVHQGATAYPRLPEVPAWDTLTRDEQELSARKMEIYASMIEYMDDQIGRLVKHLEDSGQLENTLIIFMSDNGAAGEDLSELVGSLAPEAREWFSKTFDNRLENIGRPGSCVEYGPGWAQVGSVPLRLFKGVEAEGGIRSPLIVCGPGVNARGGINRSILHVTDVASTLLDLADVTHPARQGAGTLVLPQGRSLWPLLTGRETQIRSDADWLGWELFGNRAVRQGDWKLLYLLKRAGGSERWELFNVREDPAELNDLSALNPDKLSSLLKLWDEYVRQNGVILSNDGPFKSREAEKPGQ